MELEKEIAYYQSIKEDLLSTSEGKYVLVVGEELIGTYDSSAHAYKVGVERFGNVPMLIKQVLQVEGPESFPALIDNAVEDERNRT